MFSRLLFFFIFSRDKVWAIFQEGTSLATMVFENLIIKYPVPKEKLGASSVQIFKELLARCTDSNKRVQEKAEDTLEAMITNEKIRNAGSMHEELLKPLKVSANNLLT